MYSDQNFAFVGFGVLEALQNQSERTFMALRGRDEGLRKSINT